MAVLQGADVYVKVILDEGDGAFGDKAGGKDAGSDFSINIPKFRRRMDHFFPF